MTLNSEFSTGVNSPVGGPTAVNPYAMDGGSETHSYNDNARLNLGPVSSATNASKFGGNTTDMGRLQSFKQEIYNPLDTPQPDFSVPTSGAGAAAGSSITGAAGGGVQ
jgi:hypothetical protein